MENYFFYLISYVIIFFILLEISKKLNLYDTPNKRKIHKNKVVNTGGVMIFIFYLVIIKNFEFNPILEDFIVLGFFILIVGFIDDRKNLNPSIKLILISLPSAYLIISGNFIITNLGNYDLLGALLLGKVGIIFTFLSVILLINSVNYLDGIDGLLLSFVATTFGYFIFLTEDKNIHLLIYYLLVPILINFIFNMFSFGKNFKIFNGDSGSLFFGFLISFFLIYLNLFLEIHPIILAWGVWLPIYDFLFITLYRLVKKKNIYKPDNNHLHHIILNKFKNNHLKSVVLISLINIGVIFIGFISSEISKDFSFFLFIILFLIYVILRTNKKILGKS